MTVTVSFRNLLVLFVFMICTSIWWSIITIQGTYVNGNERSLLGFPCIFKCFKTRSWAEIPSLLSLTTTHIEFVGLGGETICEAVIYGNKLGHLNQYILSQKFYDNCAPNINTQGYFYSLTVTYAKNADSYKLPSKSFYIKNIITNQEEFIYDINLEDPTTVPIIVIDYSNKWFVGGYWNIELDCGLIRNAVISTNYDVDMEQVLNNETKEKIIKKHPVVPNYCAIRFRAHLDIQDYIPPFKITYRINFSELNYNIESITGHSYSNSVSSMTFEDEILPEWTVDYTHSNWGNNYGPLPLLFGFGIFARLQHETEMEYILDWVSKIEINVINVEFSDDFIMFDSMIQPYNDDELIEF